MKITSGRREQKVFPKEYQARLTKAGGLNFYGAPNFRGIWGWSRMDWLYSIKTRSYHSSPRYIVRPSRFYIEQFRPAERYGSPQDWLKTQSDVHEGRSFELCGPFPQRGDYEMLLMLETPHRNGCEAVSIDEYEGCYYCGGGRFLQPTAFIMDTVCDLVERSRHRSARDRFNDVREGMESWSKNFDSEADAIIKDAQSPFGSQTVFLNDRNGR